MPTWPCRSQFCEDLIRLNNLAAQGLARWHLSPGMGFGDPTTWWQTPKARPAPHEGIDLCRFERHDGSIRNIPLPLQVPAILAGEIVRVFDDFLGQTIWVRHFEPDEHGNHLCSLYGHVQPDADCGPGTPCVAGQRLAQVSARPGGASPVPPHLHLSLAWLPEQLLTKPLDWPTLSQSPAVRLIDPVNFLNPALLGGNL